MTALKISPLKIKKLSPAMDRDKMSATLVKGTDMESLNSPVVNNGFKAVWALLTQFVAVGGDFV